MGLPRKTAKEEPAPHPSQGKIAGKTFSGRCTTPSAGIKEQNPEWGKLG
jgi:hypothetical protein